MAKRKSPDPDEIDRINETLNQRAGFQIQDRDSYDLAFDDYFGIIRANADQRTLRSNAFKDYVQKYPDISTERLFTKAKGRDLRRDRLKTAKRVVRTRGMYIKETAPKVDLRGYDTARQRITKAQRIQRKYTIPARVRGRIVYAVRTSVRVPKHRKRIRFNLRNKLKTRSLTPLELSTLSNIDAGKKIPRLYVQKFGIKQIRHRNSRGRFASIRLK